MLGIVFLIMACVLVHKLFDLQIIEGEDYVNDFKLRSTKTRTLKSTRGNIYDRNGEVLASNELAYSITLEDNGTYDSDRVKNLTLNGTIYKVLQIFKENGDSVDVTFHIILDENGDYVFDVDEGVTLDRFRADIYGKALVDDMTEKEASSTAEEIMDYLTGEERFSLVLTGEDAYTEKELKEYGLPERFTQEELMDMTKMRYALSTNSFQKYMPVTVATQVSNESIASIMENQDELQGVDVVEDSIRTYDNGLYYSSIVGYTGKASSEELEKLREEDDSYVADSVIGKTGMEQYMETQLQGTDGQETVYVDNLGKVLQIDEDSRVEPKAGNDVYLTIDKDWQE
ncbi:MAG: peptidase, partial [Lachnospiraceae bacterium]